MAAATVVQSDMAAAVREDILVLVVWADQLVAAQVALALAAAGAVVALIIIMAVAVAGLAFMDKAPTVQGVSPTAAAAAAVVAAV
jgi:hypothetical protein